MTAQSPLITRRTLLAALTTGIAAAPFASPQRRARAADGAAPRRLVIYWSPNGTVHKNYWPTDPTDLTSSAILSPLAAFQDRMIVSSADYGVNGDHLEGLPFSTSACRIPFADPGAKISIDQEIAGALRGRAPLPSLVLSVQPSRSSQRSFISANVDGSPNPSTMDPAVAWEYVFGPYQGGPGIANPAARKSVLDGVLADLAAIQGKLSPAEKIKLQSHLDAVRGLEKRLGAGDTMPGCAANLTAPGTFFEYDARTLRHLELVTAAFACDMTRVVSFQAAPGGHDNCNFSFMGVDGAIHGVGPQGWAHLTTGDGAPGKTLGGSGGDMEVALNEADGKMTEVHRYHAERLAGLLTGLDAIPEGDGSVLDNTVVLWLNELSKGSHGTSGVPVVIVGSLGGYLKTGQVLPSIDHGRMLITIANGMGHPLEVFGEQAKGQLPELLA